MGLEVIVITAFCDRRTPEYAREDALTARRRTSGSMRSLILKIKNIESSRARAFRSGTLTNSSADPKTEPQITKVAGRASTRKRRNYAADPETPE